ncbi:MAG: hypothetical protein ACFBSC_21240 [Microcoleaceae cyanobacterium]
MNVSEALALIDEYIDQLEDWEMSDAYARDAKSFFDFLKEYSANIGAVVNIIKLATGFSPIEIKSRGDAEQIRELLRRTQTSEFLGRRRSPAELESLGQSPGKWAKDNTEFAFIEDVEVDPDELL